MSISKKLEKRWIEKFNGFGIFSIKPIKKNELLIVDEGNKYSKEQYLSLSSELKNLCYQIDFDTFLGPKDINNVDYSFLVNHSCNPNTKHENGKWYASKSINIGEEITHDYLLLWANNIEYFEISPCLCGSKNCRGKMTGDDWKVPKLQKKYKKQFFPYMLKK